MKREQLNKIAEELNKIESLMKTAGSLADFHFGHDEKYSDKTVEEMSNDILDKMSSQINLLFKRVEKAYDKGSTDTQQIKKLFFELLEKRIKVWKTGSKVASLKKIEGLMGKKADDSLERSLHNYVTDSEKRAAVNTLQAALVHLDMYVLQPLSKLAKVDEVDEIKRNIAGEAVKMHRLKDALEKSLRAK